MVFGDFASIFSLIQIHGYWILMLGTILEGPITTAAGAFAASLGMLNLFIVIIISLLGDIMGDSIYFFIGKFGRKPIIEKYGHRFGLKKERMKWIEKNLNKHFFKTLLVMKLTPTLAAPGLMIVGASKISFKRLITNSLLIIIPASLFFAMMGYYLGLTFVSFFEYYKIAKELLLVLVIAVVLIAYLIERRVLSKMSRSIH